MKTNESFGFFPYAVKTRSPASHQNELYAMGPSPFADAGWAFKASPLQAQPALPSPEPRPRTSRRSSLGMASPLAAAAPSARTSVASYYSTSTVAPSEIDVSKALNLVHSMVSLPGSTARNSLDVPGGGVAAPTNLLLATSASGVVGTRSACMSPCSTAAGGAVGGSGRGGTQPGFAASPLPATPSPSTPSLPGTRSGRPATVIGISTAPTRSPGLGPGVGAGARTEPDEAVGAVTEASEAAMGAALARRNHRMSIDAAAGAEELATRVASGTAQAVPIFKPKPKPSPLREAKVQAQAAREQLRASDMDEADGEQVGVPGSFPVFPGSEGGGAASSEGHAHSSASSLARTSAQIHGGDEWSFGGNLQRARMKARYAAIDVAGELRYVPPPPSAAGGARDGGSESRKARKAWKVLASLASKAIGGGKYKPVPALPPAPRVRPLPRPSMAEEPQPVQRSRDSRRMLLVQRVRVGLDGEPVPLLQSQKRAGPAAAALAAAKKAAASLQDGKQPQEAPAAADAAASGGAVVGASEDAEAPHDELDAAMLAAAAAFAAATEDELERKASLA